MRVSAATVKRALVGIIFVELTFCIGLSTYFTLHKHKPAQAAKQHSVAVVNSRKPTIALVSAVIGSPMRLKIPKINVDAALDYVALTSQGALGAPKGPANAGWYDRGPRPGEKGSSVIDGHFGWKDGIPAVFDNLHALQKGDNLYVEDDRGVTTTFVVQELRSYSGSEDAAEVFHSDDGKAHLNLITCQGVWNEAGASYSNRLVIFADKTV